MPKIFEIGSIKFVMYFHDHNPPHFHVLYNDHEAMITIETLEVLEGSLPKKELAKALAWARENQGYLRGMWMEFSPK